MNQEQHDELRAFLLNAAQRLARYADLIDPSKPATNPVVIRFEAAYEGLLEAYDLLGEEVPA